tara:strand:+ start:5906 stop:6277 length:372 start_codon:yes stop_codon:yes gene_type:complete
MSAIRTFSRALLVCLAFAAYVANGMQTHLQLTPGETVKVALCGGGPPRAVTLKLSGAPAEPQQDDCCGTCLMAPPVLPVSPMLPARAPAVLPDWSASPVTFIHPGSPLWPGAPPQGPPSARKA